MCFSARVVAVPVLIASLFAAHPALAGCDRLAPLWFPPGSFTTDLSGGVARGERACFTIGAGTGQTLSVIQRKSPDNNIVFQIYQPGWKVTPGSDLSGNALKGAADGDDARDWSGKLPAKGFYLLVVGTTRGGGEYNLRIEIR